MKVEIADHILPCLTGGFLGVALISGINPMVWELHDFIAWGDGASLGLAIILTAKHKMNKK